MRQHLRFRLRSIFVLVALASCLLAAYIQWKKIDFHFETFDDYYVGMIEKIDFLGERECDVRVILEEGQTAPTLRQKWLIYKLQNYDSSLRSTVDNAANEHRVEYEGAVGDLTEEYGLPVMNRGNIDKHFGYGIVIPRLADSKDDFVVLSCYCTWDNEHGMQILIKNGQEAPWQGMAGPWEWKTPTEFLSTKRD